MKHYCKSREDDDLKEQVKNLAGENKDLKRRVTKMEKMILNTNIQVSNHKISPDVTYRKRLATRNGKYRKAVAKRRSR